MGEEFRRIFPAYSEDKYTAFKRDIENRGVQVPIDVDEEGTILDGYMRNLACYELGIQPPTVTHYFESAGEKTEHAIKVNLLRRQVDELTWANAFRRLCELRGVQLGQGARNDRREEGTSATVAEVAMELGIPERTARRRLHVAALLGEYPGVRKELEEGTVTFFEAGRKAAAKKEADRKRFLDEQDKFLKRSSRFNLSVLGRLQGAGGYDGTSLPLWLTASHSYDHERPGELVRFAISERPLPRKNGVQRGKTGSWTPNFDDGDEVIYRGREVPLLSPADDGAFISAVAKKLEWDWEPDITVTTATTRPLGWNEHQLLLPTGHWEAAVYEGHARRWWVWDHVEPREGRLIRSLGNSAVFPVRLLETVRQANAADSWVACEHLEAALETDLAAVREQKGSKRDLQDAVSVLEMGEQAAPQALADHPGWRRFAEYVRRGCQLEAAPLEPRQREQLFDPIAEENSLMSVA